MPKINKVVIFAGGKGTRLSEFTVDTPKPLVEIGGEPVVVHIMRHFYRQGCREFILATGYKSNDFKRFFRDYIFNKASVSFTKDSMKVHDCKESEDWTVHVVETGEDSTTSQRLHKVRDYIDGEPFFLTYGDSLSDIDLDLLEAAHDANGTIATLTAVKKGERFGILNVDDEGIVTRFREKAATSEQLINGGFMACSPDLLSHVGPEAGDFGFETLANLSDIGELGYYHHNGWWFAMDTKSEKDELEKIYVDQPELFGLQSTAV